jgi:peptide/nickel transport system permease protein
MNKSTYQFLLHKSIRYTVALFAILVLNFLIPRLMPGDPIANILGESYIYASSEHILKLRMDLGLEQPIYVQFYYYLINLFHGQWGVSYHYTQPITNIIIYRMRWTLILMIPSIILGATIGVFLGSLSGWNRGKKLDAFLTSLLLILYSTPGYWLAMIMVLIFAFYLDILPLYGMLSSESSGWAKISDLLIHMILPVTVLSLYKASQSYLIMRSSVIQVSGDGYILTARAKGLHEVTILFRHVLKNAILPLITVLALDFGFMISGALLVEIVFSWNGMGTLIYDAIITRDYPLLDGCLLVISIFVLLANFLSDIIYVVFDPRLSKSE